VVSVDPMYEFVVEADRSLVAVFTPTTGIELHVQHDVIFTNPVSDQLILDNITGFVWMQLTTTKGGVYHETKLNGASSIRIDSKNTPSGVFIIRLLSQDGSWISLKAIRE
jgi:hypothetical protein